MSKKEFYLKLCPECQLNPQAENDVICQSCRDYKNELKEELDLSTYSILDYFNKEEYFNEQILDGICRAG